MSNSLFRCWHFSGMARCSISVCYAHQSGRPPVALSYRNHTPFSLCSTRHCLLLSKRGRGWSAPRLRLLTLVTRLTHFGNRQAFSLHTRMRTLRKFGGGTRISERAVPYSNRALFIQLMQMLRCTRRSLHESPATLGAEIVEHDHVALALGCSRLLVNPFDSQKIEIDLDE